MFVPKNRASKYIRQKLIELQAEIEKPTVILTDIDTLLSEIDRFSRQKISEDVVKMNSIVN